MLVHDTGLRDDLGYVDLLLLSHRNRDLDTRLALVPPSMRGSKSGSESGLSRSAEDTKAVLVTSLSAWFLEASVPDPDRPQRSAPQAGDGCGSA